MSVRHFIGQYIFNLLYSLDQLANAIFFGAPDETMSSRLGRYYYENPDSWHAAIGLWVGRRVSNFLNWLQPNHVFNSIEPADRRHGELLK